MLIAFTHNLKRTDAEEEAEFDSKATVDHITALLSAVGHSVEPVDVSDPRAGLDRVERLAPDLIFNTAEGRSGAFREAAFPAVFEQMRIPFTGSDALTLAITLDKALTKQIAASLGIRTPPAQLIRRASDIAAVSFPVVVKPNFEGSSKGIDDRSIVEDADRLHACVSSLLERFPDGLLIEQYVKGQDITVPFLEGTAQHRGSVLQPVAYQFIKDSAMYDYELKNERYDDVVVQVPAPLPSKTASDALAFTRTLVDALHVRDLARADFRVDGAGALHFLEINALPSLEEGAGLYASAALEGLDPAGVIRAIVESATQRMPARRAPRARRESPSSLSSPSSAGLLVGLACNVKRSDAAGEWHDEAEFDDPETIAAIRNEITALGHAVVEIEADEFFARSVLDAAPDVVFNIAEGATGRSRESQAPALLEMLGIPYTGSDPVTLAYSLEKQIAKMIVAQQGVAVPDGMVMVVGDEPLGPLCFPLIVKPVAEGTSRGISGTSLAFDRQQLRDLVVTTVEQTGQPALVENYVSGQEITVALLGHPTSQVLGDLEILFPDGSGSTPVYTFELKQSSTSNVRWQTPASLSATTRARLHAAAMTCFDALGCRDLARIDFRVTADGSPVFIECNPLPGLQKGWSDFCLIGEAAGLSYRDVIGRILDGALSRRE